VTGLVCVDALVLSTNCLSGTEPVITRIEEDWGLVVRNPNVAKTTRQLLVGLFPRSIFSGIVCVQPAK